MKSSKQQDFEKKKDWITQMAEFYGWSYWCEDKATGHLQYRKNGIIFNVWTTKMTVLLNGKLKDQPTLKNQSLDKIEKLLQKHN